MDKISVRLILAGNGKRNNPYAKDIKIIADIKKPLCRSPFWSENDWIFNSVSDARKFIKDLILPKTLTHDYYIQVSKGKQIISLTKKSKD